MADVFSVTFILAGLMITLPALWLLMRALFPGAVDRSRGRIAATPVRCFLLGLLPAAVAFGLLVQPAPVGKGLGFLLFMVLVLVAGVGLAGLSTIVGERLPSTADEGRPWRGLVRGAICLELSFLLPFLGWFGILPLALVTGLGAATMSLRSPAPAAA
jgi:hypothetical protein